MSTDAVSAYALIAAGEDPTERVPEAVEELESLGVVVRDLRSGGRPVALNPRDILRRRIQVEFQNAEDCLTRMRALPGTALALEDAFERSQLHSGGRSEFIPNPVVVNARLQDVVGAAQFEILAAQPSGPRTVEHLEGARGRDNGALDRGVALRTLYLDTVRDNHVTAEHARMMANRPDGRPAEFRTLLEPFERAIVIDRRTAFISNTVVQGGHENAAWQITDGAFVAYIVAEFEARWRRADPWHGELRARGGASQTVDTVSGAGGVRTTKRQREILRELSAGRNQKGAARRLGISLRTFNGEIAELRDLFGAATVAELTYKWASSPDRHVDDSEGLSDDAAA
ncbi:helix-turn-helix transcriptional regulator [Streptomyces sp. NPDC002623]